MAMIAVIAIILVYFLMYQKSESMIRAVADTWLIITAFIWTETEVLSIFRKYTSTNTFVLWTAFLLLLLVLLYKGNKKYNWRNRIISNDHGKILWNEAKTQIMMLMVFGLFILVGSGLHSLNNTDSSVYHLPRIMHWIENQTVWPYATGNDLQIRYPALAEFLVAQIFLMGLPERLASLVQAIAFLLSGVMIYGISRRLGVQRKIAFVGTFIFYCAPIALAQAFTTQTDNIAAMFLLVYVYFVMDFIQNENLAGGWGMVRDGVRLAMCVMFGYLCKPTICFTMVVFFVWMCIVRVIKRDRILLLLGYIAVGLLTVILLYMPLAARTYDIFYADNQKSEQSSKSTEMINNSDSTIISQKAGNVLAPDASVIISGSNSPQKVLMTLLMNYCRSSSSAVFPKWNVLLTRVVNSAGSWLNYDVGRFAIQEGEEFYHHDTASSPTVLIGLIVMSVVVLARQCRMSGQQKVFIVCSVLGFAIQCAFMTYTLYRGRYLVGVIAIVCIAFTIVLDTFKIREEWKAYIMTGAMVMSSIGAINTFSYEVINIRDSFTGRHIHQYLINNTWLENEFTGLFDYINDHEYKNIGLYGGFNYEYIAWREIENLERLETVNVKYPEYQKYEDFEFHPDCIIRDDTPDPEETIECHGEEYRLVWSVQAYLSRLSIYVPAANAKDSDAVDIKSTDVALEKFRVFRSY